jgi:DNA-binding MarR family transcriptional regulator
MRYSPILFRLFHTHSGANLRLWYIKVSYCHLKNLTERETIGHLLRTPSLLPTELANLTKVKTQSMSHILNKLEKQGVIKRTPSKEDGRKVFISITPTGKKIVEKARHEWDEWLQGVIEKSLSEKEKEFLIKALPVLNKLIETKNN